MIRACDFSSSKTTRALPDSCQRLREESYAVDAVENGNDAVYQTEINDYDLIVLDVMIPGIAVSPSASDPRRRQAHAHPDAHRKRRRGRPHQRARFRRDDYLTKLSNSANSWPMRALLRVQ